MCDSMRPGPSFQSIPHYLYWLSRMQGCHSSRGGCLFNAVVTAFWAIIRSYSLRAVLLVLWNSDIEDMSWVPNGSVVQAPNRSKDGTGPFGPAMSFMAFTNIARISSCGCFGLRRAILLNRLQSIEWHVSPCPKEFWDSVPVSRKRMLFSIQCFL